MLLGRPGCHLCDDAAEVLDSIRARVPMTVHKVNIEDDDTLLARYMLEIPVVLAGGIEVARAPISRSQLEAALERAAHS